MIDNDKMSIIAAANAYLDKLKNVLEVLDREEIVRFINVLINAYYAERTIYIFGNGGSASTATHFASDLNKGVSYAYDKRFKVICLNENINTITAYANDLSFDCVFIEQLKNLLVCGDVVIGISGSGNSPNVIKAIEYANQKGNTTFGITGYNGGLLKTIAKYSLNVNICDNQVAEDIHLILIHLTSRILKESQLDMKYGVFDGVNKEVAVTRNEKE